MPPPPGSAGAAGNDADLEDIEVIGIPSIYRVVRALKKDDHSVFNCLASIVQDTAFVRSVIS